MVTRNPRTTERSEEYRARDDGIEGKPRSSKRCEEGSALIHGHTLECRRCHAAVDWMQAKAQATKRAKRDTRRWKMWRRKKGEAKAKMREGDGCSSRSCTAARNRGGYNAGKHERKQREYAEALSSGARILVEWPKNAADTKVWQRPDEARDAVIARAQA